MCHNLKESAAEDSRRITAEHMSCLVGTWKFARKGRGLWRMKKPCRYSGTFGRRFPSVLQLQGQASRSCSRLFADFLSAGIESIWRYSRQLGAVFSRCFADDDPNGGCRSFRDCHSRVVVLGCFGDVFSSQEDRLGCSCHYACRRLVPVVLS